MRNLWHSVVNMAIQGKRKWGRWATGSVALITILLIACGGEASPTPTLRQPTSTPLPTQGPTATVALLGAQSTGLKWERVGITGPAPSARKDATLVYDDASNSLLLFGGRQGGQGLNDLWSFDLQSERWTEITASGAPDPRWGHVAVFDSRRRQMVIFSGQRSGGFFNDTWVFDMVNREWGEATPPGDVPSPRYGSCSGYDSERDVFYISHGFTNSGRFNDTWAFDLDAQRWNDVSPSGARPIERCLHRCAFDKEGDSLLLFGGQSNKTPILGDLWSYDPSRKAWTEIASEAENPSPRFFSSLAGDANSQRVLLFGGFTSDGRKNDLWSYAEGEGWTELGASGTAPEARSNHASTFVSGTGSLYIFGGTSGLELGDLWLLRTG